MRRGTEDGSFGGVVFRSTAEKRGPLGQGRSRDHQPTPRAQGNGRALIPGDIAAPREWARLLTEKKRKEKPGFFFFSPLFAAMENTHPRIGLVPSGQVGT